MTDQERIDRMCKIMDVYENSPEKISKGMEEEYYNLSFGINK